MQTLFYLNRCTEAAVLSLDMIEDGWEIDDIKNYWSLQGYEDTWIAEMLKKIEN
jgi:hypothetical protein